MCIRIVEANKNESFRPDMPLETQLTDRSKVIVSYDPKDDSIDVFLKEVERLVKQGVSANLNITVNHNNHIGGIRLQKNLREAAQDLDINEVVKMMVQYHSETDHKLQELSTICKRK